MRKSGLIDPAYLSPSEVKHVASRSAPQDIPTAIVDGVAGTDKFLFTTPGSALEVLSSAFPRALFNVVDRITTDIFLRNAALAALPDLYMDLMRIGRATINLTYVRRAGAKAIFDRRVSPFLAFLTSEDTTKARAVADIVPSQHGDFSRPRSVTDRCRALKSALVMATNGSEQRFDAMARGPLIDQFLVDNEARNININPYVLGWPSADEIPNQVRDLAADVVDTFQNMVLKPCDNLSQEILKAREAALIFAHAWLSQAWHNHLFLQTTPLRYVIGDILIGSSPKMLGRSLAWLYHTRGSHVWRFSHGGDRAFYDDYHWGLSELPFCDRYICHGIGEAEAIAQRYIEGRTIQTDARPLECSAIGSHRHQGIYHDTHSVREKTTKKIGRKIRVLYANSSFLGETAAHIPEICLTDIQSADLQIWLLKHLRANGFEVIFKPHPKGIPSPPELFVGLYDEIEVRPFDPRIHDVDVYLFEYAGSAFFDSLASPTGVVLVHPCLRPLDAVNEADLRTRCELVDAPADEMNRYRPNPDTLTAAILRASEVSECPSWFAQRYFLSPPSQS